MAKFISETRIGLVDAWLAGYPKFEWVESAFKRLGAETVRIRNADQLKAFRGDFALFSQYLPVPENDLPPKTCPWAIWIFDLLGHEAGDLLLKATDWGRFDAVFCKNTSELAGSKVPFVFYLDQGAPNWGEVPVERPYKVCLAGRWRPSRHELAEKLKGAGVEFVTAGPGWKRTDFPWIGIASTNDQMRELFTSASVIVGDNYVDLPFYWSDRVWLAMAGGAAYCGPDVFGLVPGEAIHLWESLDEAPAVIRRALEEDRTEAALRVAQVNSYEARVCELTEKMRSVHCHVR